MPNNVYDNEYVNRVLEGSKTPVGINRTGLLFGNPISSYDINSTQNNLINLLAGYASGSPVSTASIDLEGWGASQVADRLFKIHNVRATIVESSRGETYFIYCPYLEINLPITTTDQYLKIYYQIVAYVSPENTLDSHYVSSDSSVPKATVFYKYGYVKSDSTMTPTEIVENDISDNGMDSEVSIRLGIRWTLCWESDTKPSGYTEGPIVALYRYKSASAQFLFNTSRQLALNSNLITVPTIYTKTIGGYIVLDGVYDMFMASDDSSVFMAQVVFDQTFKVGANKQIVIGVKNAPNVILEYRILNGDTVDSSSAWQVAGWVANKSYLMQCSNGYMKYTDPSTILYRTRKYYSLVRSTSNPNGYVISTTEKKFSAEYSYDSSSNNFKCTPNKTYNLSGIDHYFNGSEWLTSIPAGVIVEFPVYHNKIDNVSTGDRVHPVGTVLCDGGKLLKTKYQKLYNILAGRFGEDNSYFNLPDYTGRYMRSKQGSITNTSTTNSSNYQGGDASVKLNVSNIPQMNVSEDTFTTKKATWGKTDNITHPYFTGSKITFTGTVSNKSIIDMTNKNHFHLNGIAGAYSQTVMVCNATVIGIDSGYKITTGALDSSAQHRSYKSSLNPNINSKGIHCQGNNTNGKTYPVEEASGQNNSIVYWGITSKGIINPLDSGTDYGTTSVSLVTKIGSDSTKTNEVTPKGTVHAEHTHDVDVSGLKVGTASTSLQAVNIKPTYAYVNTYMYLGESLVIPEPVTTSVIQNQGNVYTAPTVSAELYTATVPNV